MKHHVETKIHEETVVVKTEVKEHHLVLSRRELEFITVGLGRLDGSQFKDSIDKNPDLYKSIKHISEEDGINPLFSLWNPLVKLIKE